MSFDVTRHVRIGILGNGFSGLGAAIMLKQRGIDDFYVFDRGKDVGGTWRDNSYPGCACDVESHLYSFSFAPNPDWSRLFSPQPEIFAYLRKTARDYGVVPHIRYDHEIREVRWDEARSLWSVTSSQGVYTADILISCLGALCEPSFPKIPGIESFTGASFHSARWDHDYELRGKRVAVIGTGASAIQFVPEIQREVQKLTLFQRTPAWVVPRFDRAVSGLERALYRRFPAIQKAVRGAIYARRELFVLGLRNPGVMALFERAARAYLLGEVRDPVLRKKLTPNFRMGCKRILISRDYLPALTQPNVAVVTDGIREVRGNALITDDGARHEVDAIIYGTGFKVTEMPFADFTYGREGRSLNEVWRGSPKAHLGTTMTGFPNLFTVLGPNTGLGHTSVVLMAEAQLKLVMEAIDHLGKKGLGTVDVKPEVVARSVKAIDHAGEGTVWTAGGCDSWYLDRTGRNSTIWPGFTFEFMRKSHFRPRDYTFGAQAPRALPASDHG